MVMQKVEYIPKTSNINKDRKYFIYDDLFIKVDTVIERGYNEAVILKELDHPYIQRFVSAVVENNEHFLVTKYFEGETLENCTLTEKQKLLVQSQFFELLAYTSKKNIIHGDINVSNVIFNGNQILVIDWETAKIGNATQDLFGVHNHQGIINTLRMI